MGYTYQYPRPAVTADIALFSKEKEEYHLLLIQRKRPPFQNMWALPGGFMDINETLEACAKRELYEETGIAELPLEQFRSYSELYRDPRHRTVTCVFFGVVDRKPDVVPGDDAADARWFNSNSLPSLAFDHKKIIQEIKDAGLLQR